MKRFDDPRLELAVRAAAEQAAVSPTEITHLRAAELGVRRLGGVEQLRTLRWLDLARNPLSSVAELGTNTALVGLRLAYAGIPSLRGLEGLPQLEELDLYSARVLDIDALTGLPALRSLDLGLCLVRDLRPLRSLTTLESLTLGNPTLHVPRRMVFSPSSLVSLDLQPLRRLGSLRQLRLYGLQLPSPAIFEELVNLEELVLDRCQFAEGMRRFPRLPRLETLSLARCEQPELEALAGLPRLRTLDLDEATLDSVDALRRCSSLESISLRDAELSDQSSATRLRELPRLIQLRVGNYLY